MQFVSQLIDANKNSNGKDEGKQKGHQKKPKWNDKDASESSEHLIKDDLVWLLKEINATVMSFFKTKKIDDPNHYIFSEILPNHQELLVQNL